MALYSYTKVKQSPFKTLVKVVSLLMMITGLSLLIFVFYPILVFEFYYAPKFAKIVKPIADDDGNKNLVSSLSQVLGATFVDYTKASVWFPKASQLKLEQNQSSYLLSIPKLKIDNANVLVGGEDLAKSLIHFTGPLPGTFGNSIIFGHSTLLWFYNSKDYKAIFSKLPELDLGDKIIINSDNITYTFKIFQMYITTPDDLTVLDQEDNETLITLITCVPPGTYLERFIVKASLEKV